MNPLQFADSFIKELNIKVYKGLQNLTNLLNVYKISLYIDKTEMNLFKPNKY